jgi:hypothetical protein
VQLSTELPHNLYGLLRLRLPDGGRTQDGASGSLCVHRDALIERGSAARRPLGPVLLMAAIACRDGFVTFNFQAASVPWRRADAALAYSNTSHA